MKKKAALALAAVALAGTLAVGGTLAWFTDTETATNVVTTGNVDIAWIENDEKITETNTGVEFGKETPVTPNATLTKKAYVTNEGKNAALIRAKVEVPENAGLVIVNYTENSGWVDGEDGWYYYVGIVKPGEETKNLIDSLTINPKATNGNADRENVEVKLLADAMQADNTGVTVENITAEKVKEAFNGVDILSYDTEK